MRYSDRSIVSSNFWTNFSSVGLTSEGLYILNSELRTKGQCWQIRDRLKERSAAPILAIQVSLLTSIVLGGHKGHLADGGRHCLFPDLDLDGCSIFGECRIHVTHGNVLFQAGRGAAAGHLTCTKHKGICLSKEILLYSFFSVIYFYMTGTVMSAIMQRVKKHLTIISLTFDMIPQKYKHCDRIYFKALTCKI